MKKLSRAALVFAALLAACKGSDSSGPGVGPPSRISIATSPASSAVVGSSAGTMGVFVADASGNAVANAVVSFTTTGSVSVSPASSTTDATGAASTTVTAGTVGGDATVVASVAGTNLSATARITVLSGTGCAGVASPTPMNVGDVTTFSGVAAGCVSGTPAGAEFALIAFNSSADAAAVLSTTVTGTGLGAAPSTSIAPTAGPLASVGASSGIAASRGALVALRDAPAALVPDERFHLRLQARASEVLRPRVAAARAWYRARAERGAPSPLGSFNLAPSYSAIPATVKVGDVVRVNVNANTACSNPTYHGARVAAIGTRSIVLADTLNPSGGFTDADYARFAARFDTLVYPLDVDAFGAPSDIDGNGKVVILFTRAVNELTPAKSSSYVGGFFYERDLFPASNPSDPSFSCPASNEGEMFYMLAPDPNGVVNNNVRRTGFVDTITTATIAHEFQHLINAAHRLYVNTAARNVEEAVWLNEGLSHIAEELLYYRETGRQPRMNLGGADVYTNSRATYPMFKADAAANFSRLISYLSAPGDNSPVAMNDSLATRGATWLFLRYAVDQLYATDAGVWARFDNSTSSGLGTLGSAFGPVDLPQLFKNWAIANYLDDLGVSSDARFTHKSWNARSIYGTVFGSYDATNTFVPMGYPLKITPLQDGVGAGVRVAGTSASYYRLSVPAGREALLSFSSGAAAPSSALQFIVVRTK